MEMSGKLMVKIWIPISQENPSDTSGCRSLLGGFLVICYRLLETIVYCFSFLLFIVVVYVVFVIIALICTT